MADPRVTQGGFIVGIEPDPNPRVTQGGFIVGHETAPNPRVTQGGFLVGTRVGPVQPTLSVVAGATSAALTGSTYVHPDALPHLRAHWQVATDPAFATIVYENEEIYGGPAEDPPTDTATPLVTLVTHYARVRYYAADGWSDFSFTVVFDTLTPGGCGFVGPVLATTYPSGGLTVPNAWGNYLSIGNELDGLLIAVQQGSLNGPRIKYVNSCALHDQAEVVGYVYFDGEVAASYYSYYSFFWSTYQSIEWSEGGFIALGKGSIEAGTFSGITASLQIGTPAAAIFGCPQRGLTADGQSYFAVRVWENGSAVKYVPILVPEALQAVARPCGTFVKYGLRLRVTKSAAKTWDIKASYAEAALPPAGGPWKIETTHVSEVLDCGYGGPCAYLLPGATLGPAGAIAFQLCQISNITESCVPGSGVPASSNPSVIASSNCAFLHATASGWSGPGIGPATEAKWDIRRSDDPLNILYTTGWQSEQILGLTINLFDHPEIEPGLSITIEVTLRDAALNTSTTSIPYTVTTGEFPTEPVLTVLALFANVVIVNVSGYSSPSGAAHLQTTIAAFLASDTDFSDPLAQTTFEAPDPLVGQFSLAYDFVPGEEYRIRAIFVDEFGCASSGLTEFTTGGEVPEEGVEAPPQICPTWAPCDLGPDATWVPCSLAADATPNASGFPAKASWITDCKDVC